MVAEATAAPPVLQPSLPHAPLKPMQAQVTVAPIDPTVSNIEQWAVQVAILYSPVDSREPGTTVTTTTFANCPQSQGVVFVPVPRLFACKRTYERTLEVHLPQAQRIGKGNQLKIDYAQAVADGGARYQARSLNLAYKACSACTEQRTQVELSCIAADEQRTDEIVQAGLLLRHSGGGEALNSDACLFRANSHPGSFTRQAVLKLVRGFFTSDYTSKKYEYINTNELLDYYSAIPTRENGWIANKSYGRQGLADFCPLGPSQQYDRRDIKARLSKKDGWPYLPDVEILIYRLPSGKFCQISVNGQGKFQDFTQSARYDFYFASGELALLVTEQPGNVARTFRFEHGEPFEYIGKYEQGSHKVVDYWQRDAAAQWPERMTYRPDAKTFANQLAFARLLEKAFARPLSRNGAE